MTEISSSLRQALSAARSRLNDAGIEDATIEAEVLLCQALSISVVGAHSHAPLPPPDIVSRAQLFMRLNDPLDANGRAVFDTYLERRIAHEPTAYITGHREFCGLDLAVTPAVLIPRPETETLVDTAIEWARSRPAFSQSNWPEVAFDSSEESSAPIHRPAPQPTPVLPGAGLSIVDIGTGSGAIALALAVALPGARIVATESSTKALEVAVANARRHGLERRITFRQGDLFEPLDSAFDLVVANLPYVKTADYLELPPELRDYEPRAALDGGPDGLNVIRRLLVDAPGHLAPDGTICLEFGAGQEDILLAAAKDRFPQARISVKPDFGGRPRVLVVALG